MLSRGKGQLQVRTAAGSFCLAGHGRRIIPALYSLSGFFPPAFMSGREGK